MTLLAKIDRKFYNKELEEVYQNFTKALRKVAIFYIVSRYADISLKDIETSGQLIKISDDFEDGYTTIISDKEIEQVVKSDEYISLVKQQCVISLCSIFEHFVNRLLIILKIEERTAISYKKLSHDFNLGIDTTNQTLRKIYYIIKQLGIESHPFVHDQPIKLLGEIFTIRNVIIHSNGLITRPEHEKVISNPHKKHNQIQIPDNSIDDFLHRIIIHMSGFTKRIDEYLENKEQ